MPLNQYAWGDTQISSFPLKSRSYSELYFGNYSEINTYEFRVLSRIITLRNLMK